MLSAGLAILLPAAPGVAGLAGLVVRPGARRAAAALGIAATAVALAAATVLLVTTQTVAAGTTLADLVGVTVRVGVSVDPVASSVAVAVGVVALLVQIYSVAYLRGDDRYGPYAAQVSLFTAAMFDVVVAGDLVQLLIGWEVMGICSYLLIGHDRSLATAPAAAVKAFLVTRVGDVGFWIGVILLGTGAGSFRIDDVITAAATGELSHARVTAAVLLLLAGVAGKSAQFPLHSWLPDAMAGPTPISALIHAATMVAAGIYVVTRLYPLFVTSRPALVVLALMASVTMLLGALAATAADDLKRVLAWSTVSQLAYMAGALAVGSDRAAIFHLLAHAAFKALLFLAAGSVIHAVGSNLMSRMGGLRRGMPITFVTMTIGLAALAGVPPFAGFWSKDSILSAAQQATNGLGAAPALNGWLILVCGLATVAITAWYVTRLWLRTFFGDRRGPAGHEPARVMWVPLVLLSIPATLLGLIELVPSRNPRADFGWFAYTPRKYAEYLPSGVPGSHLLPIGRQDLDPVTMTIGLVLVALGVVTAILVWRRDTAADPARVLGRAAPLLRAGFRFDDAQRALVVRPVQALATTVWLGDARVVDGAVREVGSGAVRLGRRLARLHTGLPRSLAAVLAGAVLLALVAVLVGGVR